MQPDDMTTMYVNATALEHDFAFTPWEIPVSHYCFLHCQIEISSLSPLLGAARPQTPRCFSGISLGFAST